jgi:uncharacterized protein (DUF885 family)
MSTIIKSIIIVILVTLTYACSQQQPGHSEEEIALASLEANEFFDRVFDDMLDRSPMYQSYLGIKKDYGKWDDISEEAARKELEISKSELENLLDSINPDQLDEQTKVSYRLFKESSENDIEDYKWRFNDYPVNQMHGFHSQIPAFLINIHQITDSADAAAYISRLHGLGPLFDQVIEQMKIREEKGIVPPKFVFPMVIRDCENVLTGAPFETGEPSTLLADFQSKTARLELSDDLKASLIKEASDALTSEVKPAYNKLITFLKDQETRATTDDGIWKWPDGLSYYNVALKRTTTTDMTADQIHEFGLSEVDRIHNEMREIMKKVAFEGTLQEFFEFLKQDQMFYYPNTDEGKEAYLDSAKTIIDNMRVRLDELFITKPKADMVVKRVEAFRENSAGKAFYQAPAPDGSRPGTYYANLANTQNMPKYEMEALAYHEGIPGHHMDRSISQELTDIPKFRKYGGYTAHVEGWGLYSEYIPKELGMYADPYSDYGRLAMELWRACRLVVDTGIHAKKWTREEGIAYYQDNTSGSERECIRMVERHIVMPSQATAYKIGMMKILELREKAEKSLGDQFDIREFHDVVLTNGGLPLTVLEELVNEWVKSKA